MYKCLEFTHLLLGSRTTAGRYNRVLLALSMSCFCICVCVASSVPSFSVFYFVSFGSRKRILYLYFTYLLYLLLRNTHLINAPLIDSTTYLAHCISSSSALERHHITYSAAYKSKRGVLNVMETVPDKNHHPITRPSYLIDRGVSAK